MLTRAPRTGRGDDGVVAILVAIFAVVMFGFAAIIVDLGAARAASNDAQNAADAAVLAAAEKLPEDRSPTPAELDDAVDAAKAYALDNYGTDEPEWTSCLDSERHPLTPSSTQCISFTVEPDEVVVRVRIPQRRSESFFGGIVGYDGLVIAASAEAAADRSTTMPACVVCLLGPGPHDLQSGELTVSGGDTRINGHLWLNDDGLVQTAGTTHVHLGAINRPDRVSDPEAYPSTPLADPLASLSMPDTTSLQARSAGSLCGSGAADGPGRYGVVSLGDGGTCVLQPGLYVFTGPLSIDGTRGLDASAGVTLFFACGNSGTITSCASDSDPGRLSVTGSGDVDVAASTSATPAGEAVQGLAIVFDRTNDATLFIGGGGAASRGVSGTIYGRSATVDVRVPACRATDPQPLQSLVVVDDLRFTGAPGPCLGTSYSAADNVTVTTATSGGLVR